jgi:hypothetical protein
MARLFIALLALAFLSGSSADATSYKKFQSLKGTNAVGEKKGKYNAIVGGAASASLTSTHGLQGNIFTAPDDSHYMYSSAGVTMGVADDMTLCARYYRHEAVAGARILFGIGTDNAVQTNSFENGFVLNTNGADDFQIRSYDSDDVAATFSGWDGLSNYNNVGAGMPLDEYTTVCVVYDGSADVAQLYLNGVSVTRSNLVAHQTLTDDADRVLWLLDIQANNNDPWGYFSHFGLWSRELTAAEVLDLDAIGAGDWQVASGNYGASAVSALLNFYIATDGTIATFQTDRVGTHNLTNSDDAPVDAQFTAHGSEEADFTP